jgi:hypothetical protein
MTPRLPAVREALQRDPARYPVAKESVGERRGKTQLTQRILHDLPPVSLRWLEEQAKRDPKEQP